MFDKIDKALESMLETACVDRSKELFSIYFTEEEAFISQEKLIASNIIDSSRYNYKVRYDEGAEKIFIDTIKKNSTGETKTQTNNYKVPKDRIENVKKWVQGVGGRFLRDGNGGDLKDEVVYTVKKKLGMEEFPFLFEEDADVTQENVIDRLNPAKRKEAIFEKLKEDLASNGEKIAGIMKRTMDEKWYKQMVFNTIANDGRMAVQANEIFTSTHTKYADIDLAKFLFKTEAGLLRWGKENGFIDEESDNKDVFKYKYDREVLKSLNTELKEIKLTGIGRLFIKMDESGMGFVLVGMKNKFSFTYNASEGFFAATQPGNNAGVGDLGGGSPNTIVGGYNDPDNVMDHEDDVEVSPEWVREEIERVNEELSWFNTNFKEEEVSKESIAPELLSVFEEINKM